MQYDIAVIGGGPAGVSAAVTAASKGRKVILFEAHGFSPRLRSVAKITDYLGIPDISGSDLMDIFVKHLRSTDVDVVEAKIISLREVGEGFELGVILYSTTTSRDTPSRICTFLETCRPNSNCFSTALIEKNVLHISLLKEKAKVFNVEMIVS